MRTLILKDEKGGTAYLTTESSASKYGIPVLEITAEDVGGTFGPADMIGDLEKPESLMTPAEVVAAWGRQPERTQEERDAAVRFLRQWPEGPQI